MLKYKTVGFYVKSCLPQKNIGRLEVGGGLPEVVETDSGSNPPPFLFSSGLESVEMGRAVE